MNYKISILFSLALVALQTNVRAEISHYENLFTRANEAYKLGQYDSAKTLYTEIAQNGMVSPQLFYNLGNVHYKLGSFPAAILYFERAHRLAPHDEDIQYNLEIANNHISDKINPIEKIFPVKWLHAIALSFTTDTWSVIFLVLLSLTAAFFTLFATSHQRKLKQLGFVGGIAIGIGATVVLFVTSTSNQLLNRTEAIVMAPSVNVKSEPSLNGNDQFVIHAGLKVEVMDTEGEWMRIKLADGNSGWLNAQSIEAI